MNCPTFPIKKVYWWSLYPLQTLANLTYFEIGILWWSCCTLRTYAGLIILKIAVGLNLNFTVTAFVVAIEIQEASHARVFQLWVFLLWTSLLSCPFFEMKSTNGQVTFKELSQTSFILILPFYWISITRVTAFLVAIAIQAARSAEEFQVLVFTCKIAYSRVQWLKRNKLRFTLHSMNFQWHHSWYCHCIEFKFSYFRLL
jgi:hypothetical protein